MSDVVNCNVGRFNWKARAIPFPQRGEGNRSPMHLGFFAGLTSYPFILLPFDTYDDVPFYTFICNSTLGYSMFFKIFFFFLNNLKIFKN